MIKFDLNKTQDASVIINEEIIVNDKKGVQHTHKIILTANDSKILNDFLVSEELNEFERLEEMFKSLFKFPEELEAQFDYDSKFALFIELGKVVDSKTPSSKKSTTKSTHRTTK